MALLARDVMQEDAAVVAPETPLAELERLFADAGVSGFPVLRDGTAVGVVTRADVLRVLGDRRSRTRERGELRVEDVMTRTIVAVTPETPLVDVAHTLVAHRVHRALVIDDGGLAGIVSTLDIVELLAHGKLREA